MMIINKNKKIRKKTGSERTDRENQYAERRGKEKKEIPNSEKIDTVYRDKRR